MSYVMKLKTINNTLYSSIHAPVGPLYMILLVFPNFQKTPLGNLSV